MTNKTQGKLNTLLKSWVPGSVVVQSWLTSHGISPNLTTWYLKSGWLEAIGRGAYVRPGDEVTCLNAVACLQHTIKLDVHVGGKSALELSGLGHYIRLLNNDQLVLFGEQQTTLPAWFNHNKKWNTTIDYYPTNLFNQPHLGLNEKLIDRCNIIVSAPERAIMETLYLVPQHQGIGEAYLLMENLVGLRPTLVQQLLESCHSIKVKRLFMHFAEKVNHAWLKHIELSNVNFGSGKRSIAGGGIYHPKYLLSLPQLRDGENDNEQEL